MTGYDVKKALDSFEVIVDTREQATKKLEGRVMDFGCAYQRGTLDYGDYAANYTLESGEKLYDISGRIYPQTVIERKLDLDELAICLTHERARFTRELERAKEHGAKMYLLIENASWDMIITDKYKSWMKPKAFLASLTAFMSRYNLNIVFVNDYNAGIMIKDILYHDLAERLRSSIDE